MSATELSNRLLAVRLDGGLGNQMFQYAYSRTLPEAVLINSCWQYGLQLDKFNVTIPVLPESESYAYKVLSGYWQDEKHFKSVDNTVRCEFTLKDAPNPSALDMSHRMQDSNSVSIHVRRGDYTGPSRNIEVTLPVEYYSRAIKYAQEHIKYPNFFLFSDDIPWAEEHIELPRVCTSVHFKPYEDLWLMTQCKNSITANSTLSWWGAWLRSEGLVITPAQWFPDNSKMVSATIPERWTKI